MIIYQFRMKINWKGIFRAVLFLGLGVFLVAYAINGLGESEMRQMKDAFGNAEYSWLYASILLGILGHWLRALRWNILIEPLRKEKTDVVYTLGAVMTGYLANLAVPRLGEVTRCGVLSRYEKISFTTLIGTVITERLTDMLLVVLFTIVNVWFEYSEVYGFFKSKVLLPLTNKFSTINPVHIILFVLAGVLLFFLLKKWLAKKNENSAGDNKVKNFIKGLEEGVRSFRKMKRPGLFIFYSILIWVSYWLSSWICFFAFGETCHLGLGAGLSVLTFGSFAMIAVQGGIGAYPLMVMLILQEYNIDKATGLAYGWINWSGQFLLILAGGFFSLLFLPAYESRRKKSKMGGS
ncbi:MAG: hypothetical protein RLZZ46_1603 [Bacteroidota bacterium]